MSKPVVDESEILLDDVASQETDDVEIQAPMTKAAVLADGSNLKRGKGRPTLPKPEPVYKPRDKPVEPPVKKERTEAQKEATRKMLAARDANRAARTSVKAVKEDLKVLRDKQIADLKAQAIKEYQDSLVKKAISIKKKEIKKKIELEEVVSDDDTPLEDIRKIVKQSTRSKPVAPQKQAVPQKPTISFI